VLAARPYLTEHAHHTHHHATTSHGRLHHWRHPWPGAGMKRRKRRHAGSAGLERWKRRHAGSAGLERWKRRHAGSAGLERWKRRHAGSAGLGRQTWLLGFLRLLLLTFRFGLRVHWAADVAAHHFALERSRRRACLHPRSN
jgi:hypothetical protein